MGHRQNEQLQEKRSSHHFRARGGGFFLLHAHFEPINILVAFIHLVPCSLFL